MMLSMDSQFCMIQLVLTHFIVKIRHFPSLSVTTSVQIVAAKREYLPK